MVQFTTAFGVASVLVPSIWAHVLPRGMTHVHRDLEKTALLDNFDALDAEADRKPPVVVGAAKKWDAGKYPQNCYDKAREAISDTDARPKCELRDLEIYDVTYEDCSGRDPWILCRCANAELTLQETVDGLSTVPPGARSNVLHIVTMNGFGGGGGYSDGNSIFCGGHPANTWFSHESMHCNDRDNFAFSNSDVWNQAIAADTCVPDGYSNNNPTEDFAQVGTYLNYAVNGHAIDYTGKDDSCMKNQLDAARTYLGDRLDKGTQCFNATGNDGTVNGKRNEKRHNIIEKDPESGFDELLPHTPYTSHF